VELLTTLIVNFLTYKAIQKTSNIVSPSTLSMQWTMYKVNFRKFKNVIRCLDNGRFILNYEWDFGSKNGS
jgi:hypothetical protein